MSTVALEQALYILENAIEAVLRSPDLDDKTSEEQRLRLNANILIDSIDQFLEQEGPGTIKIHFDSLEYRGLTVKGDFYTMNLRDNQKVTATAHPRDAKGAIASIEEGSAEWSSSDDSIATVEEDADNELSAVITGGTPPDADADGNPGPAAVIQLKAKDQDGNDVIGQVAINVVAGDATTFDLNLGTPENQDGSTGTGTTPTGSTPPSTGGPDQGQGQV